MSARTPILLVAVALLLGAGVLGTWRVATLEGFELEHRSGPLTLREAARRPEATAQTARLSEVRLRGGEQALFELCAEDALAPERWAGALELLVWRPDAEELMARVALDAETLEGRSAAGARACLPITRGVVAESGRYAVEALWSGDAPPEALAEVPLEVRVLARAPLSALDRGSVALAFLGALALVLALVLGARRAASAPAPPSDRANAIIRLAAGVALTLGAAAAVSTMPVGGAAGALWGGLAFALAEVAIAIALVAPAPDGDPSRLRALGVVQPRRSWGPVLAVTALVALGLVLAARLLLLVVPRTGEAPIETFVSWPSGLLSFALLAVLVPLAEEVFFRGFVYEQALRLGRVAAFLIAAGLFVAAHAPQVWGGWGGLAAVLCTGIGLTALRAWSGSLLPGALAHLAYNALLASSAVF